MPEPDRETRIDQTDAKGGSREGVVRWVLLVSLGLAIVAMTVIWVTGALTQDNVESQGTATGRIEAQAEADNAQREGLAEEGGLVAQGTEESNQPPAGRERGVAPNAD